MGRGLENGLPDPQLTAVMTAWPELPEAIKVGILAMVKAIDRIKLEDIGRRKSAPERGGTLPG